MQDGARDFAATLIGRRMRVRLPQAGVHQLACLPLHRDREFPAPCRRHPSVDLDLERFGVGLVCSRQHEINTARQLLARKLRAEYGGGGKLKITNPEFSRWLHFHLAQAGS